MPAERPQLLEGAGDAAAADLVGAAGRVMSTAVEPDVRRRRDAESP